MKIIDSLNLYARMDITHVKYENYPEIYCLFRGKNNYVNGVKQWNPEHIPKKCRKKEKIYKYHKETLLIKARKLLNKYT